MNTHTTSLTSSVSISTEMLENIRKDGGDVDKYVDRAKDKSSTLKNLTSDI